MTHNKSLISILLFLPLAALFLPGLAWGTGGSGKSPEVAQKATIGKEKLAVLDMEAVDVDSNLAYAMSVVLRDELHSYGKYEVLSREDLLAVAKRLSLQQQAGDDCADDQCLVSFGRKLGTRYMVAGVFSKVGNTYSVSLRLLDTEGENAGVLNRVYERCKCSQDELFDTVAAAAAKLMGRTPVAAAQENGNAGKVYVPAKPPSETDPNGSGGAILSVSSEPSGAKVWLGSRELGVTPYTGSSLPAGRFSLRLEKGNFNPVNDSLELINDLVVKKNYLLPRLNGSLTVLSTPPGATIYLDDKEQADRTPASFPGVPVGSHQVKIHLDRYYDSLQNVEVAVGKAGLVSLTLSGGDLEECGGKWLSSGEAELCRAASAKSAREALAAEKAAAVEVEARKLVPLAGEFSVVPGGCFKMGDTFGDGSSDEKPVHEVCVDGFQIGKYEVTQGQWRAVMGNNPSKIQNGDNYPVERVSWSDVQDFINILNQKTGEKFRLPTEAEWEYAARSGGKQEKYAGGEDIDEVAWYRGNSDSSTHPVGKKKPNGLGLYDMSGNVFEWCQDWYDGGGMFAKGYYDISSRNNPTGPVSGSQRTNRGGGWVYGADIIRASRRGYVPPNTRLSFLGFRLALPK